VFFVLLEMHRLLSTPECVGADVIRYVCCGGC